MSDPYLVLGIAPVSYTHLLGFTFICGKSRSGAFLLQRKTRADRMVAKLVEITRANAKTDA